MRNISPARLLQTIEDQLGTNELINITKAFNELDVYPFEEHRIEMDEDDLKYSVLKVRRGGLKDLKFVVTEDTDMNTGLGVPTIYGITGTPDPHYSCALKFIFQD